MPTIGNQLGTAVSPATLPTATADGSSPVADGKKSFSDVWKDIQAKYSGREEKPREAKKALGKDDFLRIMITQLSHQDPTKPMEADKMATEMAQLTSVEQLSNVNKNIEKLADRNSALDHITMAGLIGKQVTVDRNRFPHLEGEKEPLSFTLKENAAAVKLSIVSDTGETVYEKDLGPQRAGDNSFVWDGKKLNTIAAKGGNYELHVDAKAGNGRPLLTDTQVRSTVVGVNFEGKEPVLLVGTPGHTDKVTLRNVIKIESGEPVMPGAAPASASAENAKNGLFTFVKGEGSKPLDINSLSPQAKAAIDKLTAGPSAEAMAAEAAARKDAAAPFSAPSSASLEAPAPAATGFPSGLEGG